MSEFNPNPDQLAAVRLQEAYIGAFGGKVAVESTFGQQVTSDVVGQRVNEYVQHHDAAAQVPLSSALALGMFRAAFDNGRMVS